MAAALLFAAQGVDQVQEEPTTSTSVSEWFTPSTVGAMVLILVLISGYFKRRQISNDSRRGESFSPLCSQDQHLILIISTDAVSSTNGSNGRHSYDQSVWPLESVTVLPLDVINPAPISPSSLPSRPPLAYYPSNTRRHNTTMPVSRTQQRLARPKRTSSCPSQRQRCVTRPYAACLSSQLIQCK
jgi:hypothetical protein